MGYLIDYCIYVGTLSSLLAGRCRVPFTAEKYLFSSPKLQIGSEAHPASIQRVRGMNLTTSLHLVSRLRTSWSCICTPLVHFRACTRTPLPLPLFFLSYMFIHNFHNSRYLLFSTRVGTLIVATIYLQLIQNRYMFHCPSV